LKKISSRIALSFYYNFNEFMNFLVVQKEKKKKKKGKKKTKNKKKKHK